MILELMTIVNKKKLKSLFILIAQLIASFRFALAVKTVKAATVESTKLNKVSMREKILFTRETQNKLLMLF